MKMFLKNNLVYFCFLAFSIILELSTLVIITDSFLIKQPWISLIFLLLFYSLYILIPKKKVKCTILFLFSTFQLVLSLVAVVLFENTGSYFDFSMLQLIGETSKFMNTININYWYIIYAVGLYVIYIISSIYLSRFIYEDYRLKYQTLFSSLLLVATLVGQAGILIYQNKISEERFVNNLYKDTYEKYNNYGNIGNFTNEISKMLFFNKYNKLSNEEIEKYIYENVSTPSEVFGVSKGNNLVTILVESLEWFAFINDPELYPNQENLDEETLDILFPNLREFYNSSVVMNNHYSQNKTDISEDEGLLGVYPSSSYINYGFPNTTLPSSTANMIKLEDDSIVNSYFHSNAGSFYNRKNVISSLGFDNLYFIEEMKEYGVTNYMESNEKKYSNCMNVDSEMIEAMVEEMFPIDKRFNTHITTISMHGNYVYRETMKKWIDKLNSLNIEIENESLKNYLAYTMDFDYSLGLIMEYLKNNGLLENTTITLFSDHNTYLSELTYQVKDIEINSYSNNYIELYRVPLMIYDNNLGHQIINKFTTTYDVVPTILDLFGINYYTNLYYGNSIFNEEVSLLYSKAFNIFVYDGLLYSNINNILYKDENINETIIKEVEQKSLNLLKKIYYINHIFEYNYFKNKSNYDTYINKINSIN